VTLDGVSWEGPPGVSALVLPLDRVRTEAEARWVIDFAARGGRVLGVYWGSLVRPGAEPKYPVYSMGPLLGIRATGWRGAGPVLIRPGDRPEGTEEIAGLQLTRGMLVRVEPVEGATVLARWASASPPSDAPGGLLAVGFGPHLYLALDLFAPQNDTPAGRQLFYWFLEQLSPGLVYGQARERAGAALAAVIRAEELLNEDAALIPKARLDPMRQKLAEARASALRARQAVEANRCSEATVQYARARTLVDEVMRSLRPETAVP
jgi:hypothetical protein